MPEQLKAIALDAYTRKLIQQHRERLDQIEGYYNAGTMSSEQVENLLEGKKGQAHEHEKRGKANRVR